MIDQLFANRIVPVFYHDSPEVCQSVLRAVYAAGLRCFEFTNRGPMARANFARLADLTARELPGLTLGIGTILRATDVPDFINSGAQFVVSPSLNLAVGAACQTAGVAWIPGCMTISEIHQALDAGAPAVKVFPGEVVGPALVKNAKVVFPQSRIMVTGGVLPTAESLRLWFGAGADAVGIGSALFPDDALSRHDYDHIRKTIAQLLNDSEKS